MISIRALHEQNHEIAELAKTLSYLFQDREMCDTNIACELFARYRQKINEHGTHNEEIYAFLLNDQDGVVRKTADRFLAGEQEMKRLFKHYADKWCKRDLRVDDHNTFVQDTEEIFEVVWHRIQAENEQLYPLFRRYRDAA